MTKVNKGFCFFGIFLSIYYLLFSLTLYSTGLSEVNQEKVKENYKEDHVMVKFKDGFSEGEKEKVKNKYGLVTKNKFKLSKGELLQLKNNDKKVKDVISELRENPGVEVVELDYVVQPTAVSNDTYSNLLWGLDSAENYGIDIAKAWEVTMGSPEVVVAVIDTGVQIDHPDLVNNIWINSGEIAGNGKDDDGNGYVDDVNGWDFVKNDETVFDKARDDDHGTHVAGTIAATANNNEGIAGVAPNVKIMPLKFIGPRGGYTSDAILAIEYASDMGVRIANNSWGGGSFSALLRDTINNFDGVFVAAAGNDGTDNDVAPHYPSNYDCANILSVAATNNLGELASFSNYGINSVDVAAPGDTIASAYPESSYMYMSGTSMATPHASGVVALMLSQDNQLTPTNIIEGIKNSVTPLPSLDGKVASGGLLNAYNVLDGSDNPVEEDTVPPVVVSSQPENGGVDIARESYITLNFSEFITSGSTTQEAVEFYELDGVGNVVKSVVLSDVLFENATLRVILGETLNYETNYRLVVPSNIVEDLSGNTMEQNYILEFTTESQLQVLNSTPQDNATGISVNSNIRIQLDRPIALLDETLVNLKDIQNNQVILDNVYVVDDALVVEYSGLQYETGYVLTVPVGTVVAENSENNTLEQDYTLTFTTRQQPTDIVSPTVTATNPVQNETNVDVSLPEIMIVYSEDVFLANEGNDITLLNRNRAESISVRLEDGNKIYIQPSSGFVKNTPYTLLIPKGAVVDGEENPADAFELNFTMAKK